MNKKNENRLPQILFFILLVAGIGWLIQDPNSLSRFKDLLFEKGGVGSSHDLVNDDHHGGRELAKDNLKLLVSIYEKGVPPQFRIEAKDNTGKTILPANISLGIKLKRLGGKIDSFTFFPAGQQLISREVVTEPHSFDAEVTALWQGKNYTWNFSQIEARTEISDEIAQISEIKIAKAASATLSVSQNFTGEVGLDEGKVAHVLPRLDAVVTHVFQHLGDNVQEGETLAVLDSRELADAKGSHIKAKKKLEPALLDLERQELLFKNTSKLLELLSRDQDMSSLDKTLDEMILGEVRAQLIPALAKWKQTHAAYIREKKLFDKKISSESDFLAAREQHQSAGAQYNALKEKIAYDNQRALLEKQKIAEKFSLDVKTTAQKLLALGLTLEEIEELSFDEEHRFTQYDLRSPLTGEVIQKHLAVGEAVGKNDDIYVIANLSSLWVNVAIPARFLGTIKVGQKARIIEEHQGLKTRGVLSYLGSVIDEKTRSVTGRVVIANPKRSWRPGMYVDVDLVQSEIKVPVSVVNSAVQKFRGWDVVFVKYGNFYEARPVTLGRTDGQRIEIIEGLNKGEPYVSQNSFAIKAELGKSGATHSH
ncbi:MAG: HlyD family efflux transporter periplasmic adaptor subunit [Candidatus Nitronauta litoralis]|uniref:HlyD family efflux transporter periplasmic adaptor subunit n=1 Tax=Candidatus Nitronauta litoralis TaxID=2705533 RepID=A0A7T0BUN7_9BACT|nr:MAG: HlyD family efflux transporter periplasmic adaptor subunit [Candidatus Nitronauta litoralis]